MVTTMTVTAMMRIWVNYIALALPDRLGSVFKWTKNRIIRAVKRMSPASELSLAISSARSFNLVCRGVTSVSPRKSRRPHQLRFSY